MKMLNNAIQVHVLDNYKIVANKDYKIIANKD